MVAHRLLTVRETNRIVVIDKVGIARVGSHDELMSLCGKYYETFTNQATNM